MMRWSSKNKACIVKRLTTKYQHLHQHHLVTMVTCITKLSTYGCYNLASPAAAPASLHPPPRMASRYTSNSTSPLTYHRPSPTRPTCTTQCTTPKSTSCPRFHLRRHATTRRARQRIFNQRQHVLPPAAPPHYTATCTQCCVLATLVHLYFHSLFWRWQVNFDLPTCSSFENFKSSRKIYSNSPFQTTMYHLNRTC